MNYLEFLQAKMPLAKFDGYDTDPAEINPLMRKLLAKQQVHTCGYHRTAHLTAISLDKLENSASMPHRGSRV